MLLSRLTTCRARIRVGRPRRWRMRQTSRRCFSGDVTYYDSQSGLHIPVHNEGSVTIYMKNKLKDERKTIELAQELGLAGVMLPKEGTGSIHASLLSELASPTPDFTAFCPPQYRETRLPYADNVNIIFIFTDSDSSVQEQLASHAADGINTSIGLFDTCCFGGDPVLVASGVASLIDETGGGDFVWLAPDESEGEDEITQLCEELSYLDVAGPTIKSRLVVGADTEYQVDECLNIGVNKFVIHSDNPN